MELCIAPAAFHVAPGAVDAVLATLAEVARNEFVHFGLVAIPSPAPFVVERNVARWVVVEDGKTGVPIVIPPVLEVAMPQMHERTLDAADVSLHARCVSFG